MSFKSFNYFSIRYDNPKNLLQILDQTQLPEVENWISVENPTHMWNLIKSLSVRGAPLIGVCASSTLAMWAKQGHSRTEIIESAEYLITSRPTAVNLMYCCQKIIEALKIVKDEDALESVCQLANEILQDEVDMNLRMAQTGNPLIQDGDGILTHCNTGSAATPGLGTALGIIKYAHQQGKKIHVYVDETRPLLQGGRLTAYELEKENIPYTLICDNMAAALMREGKVQKIFVGSDRIAKNGDFANKIGTYSVAISAKYHNIPFYVVAPKSTVDVKCSSGKDIPIEERAKQEVRGASGAFGSVTWSPKEAPTWNPAFDVTPVELVTGIILDTGLLTQEDLKKGIN